MSCVRFYLSTLVLSAIALIFSACSSAPEAVSVPLLSKTQSDFQKMPRAERIAYFADPAKRTELCAAGYHPLPVKIVLPYASGVFQIRETPDTVKTTKKTDIGTITVFAPPYALVSVKDNTVELQNMKIATWYDWTMTSNTKETKNGAVRTEDLPPRLMRIDGVPNVRDLGGRIGLDGRRVKQGMIYRTAGLNLNADLCDATVEELLKRNKFDLAKKLEKAQTREKQLEAQLKAGVKPDAGTIEYTPSNQWIVFRPAEATLEQMIAVRDWKEIPQEFLGAKQEVMKSDAAWRVKGPVKAAMRPVVAAQVFEAKADGVIRIGFEVESSLNIYVNGELVYDSLPKVCTRWPMSMANHHRDIKVKKGKNLIVCPIRSGNWDFTFYMGPYTAALAELAAIQKDIRDVTRDAKIYKPGKNRLNDVMKSYLVNDLGIKSDIDLRSDSECAGMTGSPAGDKVAWYQYSSYAYDGIQVEFGRNAFTNVFKVFLNEKNYPVVFHCIAGQDRTGAVAFVLNGLLGVEEEQLYLDWESTGYWNISSTCFNHKDQFNYLIRGFDRFPGKTINERVEAYVLSLGFTKQDIDHFRNIMLEEK